MFRKPSRESYCKLFILWEANRFEDRSEIKCFFGSGAEQSLAA